MTSVIRRRTVVLGGLAGLAGIAVWQADIPPHPVADDRDTTLLADVVATHTTLLGVLKASGADAVITTAVAAQLVALGVETAEANAVPTLTRASESIDAVLDEAAGQRADDAVQAHARDLIVTLGSISAGLAQLAEYARNR